MCTRFALMMLPLLLVACAGNATHGVNTGNAPQETTQPGTVDSVKAIDLPVEEGSSGAFIGGTIGAAGGANAGSGRGAVATTILGGVVGSMVGDAIQNSGTQPGVEMWIKLDNGKSTVVRQPLDKTDEFRIGDRVEVIKDRRGTRVRHLAPNAEHPR